MPDSVHFCRASGYFCAVVFLIVYFTLSKHNAVSSVLLSRLARRAENGRSYFGHCRQKRSLRPDRPVTIKVQCRPTRGVNINPVQTTSAQTIVDTVSPSGTPIVFINREPEESVLDSYKGKCCYVGADARQSGTYQGELILETETQGDINGDGKVTYIMCKGDPENIDAQYRTEYSIKALTDAGKEVECLYEYLDNWDQTTAQQDVANALSQYGDKIEVVFCNNDAMALGALQSIQQAGRTVGKDIYLVGVDALVEAVQNVVDGNMTGTVLNDDVGQATKAAEATKLFVEGKDVEKYYWVDYVKVTKDNASQYLKED